MRVLKNNNVKYAAFYKSLPAVSRFKSGNKRSCFVKTAVSQDDYSSDHNLFNDVKNFISGLNNSITINEINEALVTALKKHFPVLEAGFYLLDKNNTSLIAAGNLSSIESTNFINDAYKGGILDWAFNTKTPKLIPAYSPREPNSRYLIIPLFEAMKPGGVYAILPDNNFDDKNKELLNFVQIIVDYAFQKIILISKAEEIKTAYNSLQSYQSKFSNDYHLLAVGEFTGGVLEDILEPLQVIMSSVDILPQNKSNVEIIDSIKRQVNKIEISTKRLRRFADRNEFSNTKIFPFDLNKLLENYFKITSSFLQKKQIECILDLEPGLPSILTHQDSIYQLLVNIFSLLTGGLTKSSGILVQTKFIKDVISLKFITTETISTKSPDPSFKIISQLVHKHEGEIKITSNAGSGTIIEILFPLKRKIRG